MANQYQDLFNSSGAWATYYAKEFAGPQHFQNRSKTETLYLWQNANVTERCHIQFREHPNDPRIDTIPAAMQATGQGQGPRPNGWSLEFSIPGGSDVPRFVVHLSLVSQPRSVTMTAIFPAWSPHSTIFNNKLNAPIRGGAALQMPNLKDLNQVFKYSDSLDNVCFSTVRPQKDIANMFKLDENAEYYQITWLSYVQPICINFNADISQLNEEQQAQANTFRKLKRNANSIRVIVQRIKTPMGAKIAYFANMPNPTPPPWPRYGSKYQPQQNYLKQLTIDDIPPLRGTNIGDMFAKRIVPANWPHKSPTDVTGYVGYANGRRNDVYVPVPIRGAGNIPAVSRAGVTEPISGKAYFLNERDYEVVRLVGLTRDLHHAESEGANLFNKTYTFDLIPADASGPVGYSTNHDFYIFLNVHPNTRHGDIYGDIPPPTPGTRVTITLDQQDVEKAASAAARNPRKSQNQSGWRKAITAVNTVAESQGRASRAGSVTSNRSRSSTQGVQSPRSIVGSPVIPMAQLSIGTALQPVTSNQAPARKFRGVVVHRSGTQHTQYDICILVSTSNTGMGLGLEQCSGHFRFGSYHQPFAQVQQAIHLTMYGEGSFYRIPSSMPENWLKTALLAHENLSIRNHWHQLSLPTMYKPDGLIFDQQQDYAFRRAISDYDQQNANNFNSRFALIQGPPGTGKTRVSATIAYHSFRSGHKLLISAGSNYAVDVLADAIYDLLQSTRNQPQQFRDSNGGQKSVTITDLAEKGIWGVYRLEKEDDEHFMNFGERSTTAQNQILSVDEEAQTLQHARTNYNAGDVHRGVSANDYRAIERWINYRTNTGLRLSLGAQIQARILKALREGTGWTEDWAYAADEYILIWQFLTQRILLSRIGRHYAADLTGSSEAEQDADDDEVQRLATNYENASLNAWRSLQSLYLKHAKIILVTASTAGRKTLRGFRANRVLIDEAGQLTEGDALNPIIRNFSALRKVILVGDRCQLPPTVPSKDTNEFYPEHVRSMLARLEDTGMPVTMLDVQRRMDPQISAFISTWLYNGQLRDAHSVNGREPARRFKQVVRDLLENYDIKFGPQNKPAGLHSLWFVNVPNTKAYRRQTGTSWMNPHLMNAVVTIFRAIYTKLCGKHKDGSTVTFAILAFYAEEVRLLRTWIYQVLRFDPSQVFVINVDAAQGKEYDYVLLSTCRPGGSLGLGFVSNAERMCVALSRAKYGLLVFGNNNMGKAKNEETWRKRGTLLWDALVNWTVSRGCNVTISFNPVPASQALGLNISQWTELSTHAQPMNEE